MPKFTGDLPQLTCNLKFDLKDLFFELFLLEYNVDCRKKSTIDFDLRTVHFATVFVYVFWFCFCINYHRCNCRQLDVCN